MKKAFILLSVLCFSVMAFAQKQLVVDPHATMRNINGGFKSIIVSGGIDLYLSQSEKEELAVSASDEKYISGIKTVIEDSTLKIYYDGEKSWNSRNKNLRAYVSFKNLERLEASGASDISVNGDIQAAEIVLKLSGASDFKGSMHVNTLQLNLSGASDVVINGSATVVTIESSGASDVKAYGFTTEICHAKASGASDVNITVNKEMTAHASGASNIYFKGSAVLKEVQSSGASKVSKKQM